MAIERPPTASEMSRWRELLKQHEKASIAVDMAGFLLQNIYTSYSFAKENDVTVPEFDPSLETRYYDVRQSFETSKKAIRLVEDHQFGIKTNGSDIDIIEPPQTTFSGFIIPVAIGIVVLATAIGTAIWQSKIATDIANEYRKLLFDTNQIFCANPNSQLCKNWIQYKKVKKYDQNTKIADSLGETLKKGVKTVAGGLATGLLVAVAAVIFLRSRT